MAFKYEHKVSAERSSLIMSAGKMDSLKSKFEIGASLKYSTFWANMMVFDEANVSHAPLILLSSILCSTLQHSHCAVN